jgi:hypothetical protein
MQSTDRPHIMIRIAAVALPAVLAGALLAQDSPVAQAAQGGRKFKVLPAPLVKGKAGKVRLQPDGIGVSAGQKKQRFPLPAVQEIPKFRVDNGGVGKPKLKPKEDCMSCAD